MWTEGVLLTTAESTNIPLLHRVALLCIACDIPAARKVSGFLGHSGTLGCSRCQKQFPGEIGNKNYSGFGKDSWVLRNNSQHRASVASLYQYKTPSARGREESKTGARYSVLLELEYVDIVRFTIIHSIYNLFLGTAKSSLRQVYMVSIATSDSWWQMWQERT